MKAVDLLEMAKSLRQELAAAKPKRESLEWHLINNLDTFGNSLESATSAQDIKNACAILGRFCFESMNWDTPLYRRCSDISEQGLKLAKRS